MINETTNEEIIDNSQYSSFVGIKFANAPRAYFFGLNDLKLKLEDSVIVETARGIELGKVAIEPISMEKYKSSLGLKPILRLATETDIKVAEQNAKDAAIALEICIDESDKLGLKMNLISCEYTLDKAKVIFSYLADERVDFRELLKILASKLHTRIELRQIGSRDKAKMVGGIGICGLPLCCSTFLNEFDGISLARAKNQMLAINIPKLSGHCGKLICCLKYEDDTYLSEREKYPELGSKVFIDKIEFTVTNVNIISSVIKVESQEDVKFLAFDEFVKQTHWHKKFIKDNATNEDNDRKKFNNKEKYEKK